VKFRTIISVLDILLIVDYAIYNISVSCCFFPGMPVISMVMTPVNNNPSLKKFLLVVDSNRATSSGMKALLKQFQYKAWSVHTADEALELVDIVMPSLVIIREVGDMTQVDFIKNLKRLDASGKVSVIVVSSSKDADNERNCLSAGAVTCLRPPLNVETLYRTIQVAIENVPRMNLRINTKVPVIIDDKTVTCGNGKVATMLSESGLFVRTADPCQLKTKIPVTFKLAGKVISTEAVVIYAHEQGNPENLDAGMGLQFVRISEQDQAQIRSFIREQFRKGIAVSQRT
jgi:CheY-like chemotaxis protein